MSVNQKGHSCTSTPFDFSSFCWSYTDKEQNNWPSNLPGILMALRNSPSSQSTDYSPFYMVYGIEMNLPFDIHKIPKDSHLSQNSKEQL